VGIVAYSIPETDIGATVVITHRVSDEKHAEYEVWLDRIAPRCKAAPGNLDWHVVRPVSGLSDTYTVIIRFDTEAHLNDWMASRERGELIEEAEVLFGGPDDFYISSGLDFWFTPPGSRAKAPARWKQSLITWSAIYPLVLGIPYVVSTVFQFLGVPRYKPLTVLVTTALAVFLMTYVIMPGYTRLVRRWLRA
tara:strand:- start:1986 stop:2564 length:579 start_codon:yes stop_codon:yes gene_type:complete